MKISRFNPICNGSWFKMIGFMKCVYLFSTTSKKEIFLMNLDECIHLFCTKLKKKHIRFKLPHDFFFQLPTLIELTLIHDC